MGYLPFYFKGHGLFDILLLGIFETQFGDFRDN